MYKIISNFDFHEEFKACGRGDQFSYAALEVMFTYYDDTEEMTGDQIVLNVQDLCCEWHEYASIDELETYYGKPLCEIRMDDYFSVYQLDNGHYLVTA